MGTEETLGGASQRPRPRRGGIDYDFLGVVSGSEETDGALPVLGTFADLPQIFARNGIGE